MSRFDFSDDEGAMPLGLWRANVARAIRGRRGQRMLAELERALLALPEPRLIDSQIAEHGEVCAIGALAVARFSAGGTPREEVLADLERGYFDDGDYDTAMLGAELGMSETLAWHVAYLNDERFADKTPEQRYDAMLAWVRENLQRAEAVQP